MKRLWLSISMAVLLVAVGLGSASAESGTTVVTPSQLTIVGTRGAVETRTILIRPTSAITNLRLVPLDLTGTDGTTILPATAIHPAAVPPSIEAGDLLTVPIIFDLRDVPSGRFEGDILLDGSSLSVALPVQVSVRDQPYLPFFFLLLGVVLGVGVSTYRSQGRPRDEILVRVGRLRSQMQDEDEPAADIFRSRVASHLVDVEAGLQNNDWDAARSAIEQAEQVWLRWLKGRTDWSAQVEYQKELVDKITPHEAVPYARAIRRQLDDLLLDMPDLSGPDEMRDRLEPLAQRINRYLELDGLLNELDGLVYEDDQIHQAQELRRRVESLSPDDENFEETYRQLKDEISQAIGEARKRAPATGGPGVSFGLEDAGRGVKGATPSAESLQDLLAPPPSARPLTSAGSVEKAGTRLRYFTWASYAVVVALLAGAGFGELYVANPTFGAHPWGDYFSLLAWGFGAEATRSSVTEMVKNWQR